MKVKRKFLFPLAWLAGVTWLRSRIRTKAYGYRIRTGITTTCIISSFTVYRMALMKRRIHAL